MFFPPVSFLRWILLLAVCMAGPLCGLAQQPAITLTPAVVEAGSPELIRVAAPDAAAVDGEWMGQKLAFFPGRDRRAWFALAGVDVEGAVGPSALRINIKTAGMKAATSAVRELDQTIEIHEAHYRTGSLSVAPQFVEPGPEAMKEIDAQVALKAKVFAASAPEPLWSGNFRAPVTAAGHGQLRHAAHLQRQAGQRAQGDGFSRARGDAGACRQQRSSGAGAPALL